jgi:tRNA1(Val) A37 N6-methylase TrmN6
MLNEAAPNAGPELEEIHVLDRKLRLLHLAQGGFRTSLDTVLLGAACAIEPGQSLLDAGCGVGGAGLCVLRRVKDVTLTGVDIQGDLIAIARQNAVLNGFDAAFFDNADIRDYAAQFQKPVFDHVICNPPYMEAGTYTASPDAPRATALGHDEDGGLTLSSWVVAAHRALKSKGSLTMVHRADMLGDILAALGPRFGDCTIIPIWPKAGEPARRVIIRAYKDRKGRPALSPGLVLHEAGGAYTKEADAILRDACKL